MVVYIVGAGPGDPELLTLKAKYLIEHAEIIIYDKLINKDILNWASTKCDLIYVGKREKTSDDSQEIQSEINNLLQKYGPSKRVVRLKGGDPCIFGRGGEEAEVCEQFGIPFEIIPGISSAFAAPLYAGIPVSHRNFNSSFAVLTGHESEKKESSIDWERLPETIIILMGIKQIKNTAKKLLAAGRNPQTLVAAIYNGTTIEQRTEITTLEQLAKVGVTLSPPVVFIIGPIVSLHKQLNWFEKKLSRIKDKKVVLTRAKNHEEDSKHLFESYGIKVISMPLIEIIPKTFEIPALNQFDALVFTSLEGVRRVSEQVDLSSVQKKIFAIGPKTRDMLNQWNCNVTMGEIYNSEGLADHIMSTLSEGSKILALRSSAASDTLKKKLSGMYDVTEVDIYDIKQLPADPEKIKKGDAVFVVSASCAKSLSKLKPLVFKGKTVVSIGPETSRYLTIPHITSSNHTIQGMIQTYLDYLWTGCL